ncbi:uncharacterized protein LOC111112278 isoform X2 [Crassostrea virginica]
MDMQCTGRLRWHEEECMASSWELTTVEWRVDLGAVKSIHHVFIQYMTENLVWDKDNGYTAYSLGFSVYISNTTNKEDGVLCFRDTNYTRATIPNPVNITCPYQGKYVIYYNNRTHRPYPEGYSDENSRYFCEVEVYGCPILGFYGESCSIPCPQYCFCHITEGTCLGCFPGYMGLNCNEKCGNNTYGVECRQSCGNCSNGEPCHHVDGSCQFGCEAGVYGKKCDIECPAGRYGRGCSETCGDQCQGCNRFSGVCELGCLPGWTGQRCDEPCTFGNNEFDQVNNMRLFSNFLFSL